MCVNCKPITAAPVTYGDLMNQLGVNLQLHCGMGWSKKKQSKDSSCVFEIKAGMSKSAECCPRQD